MQSQLFTLPKERIKVTYTSEQAGETENIELPFKLLMIGNYKGYSSLEAIGDRRSICVDHSNFSDVMRESNVTLKTCVPDRLSDAQNNVEQAIAVNLNLNSLKDFKPDAFIKQIPELDKLIKFRKLLVKAKTHPKQIKQTIDQIKQLLLSDV